MWYTITIAVEYSQGDYGSVSKVLVDRAMTVGALRDAVAVLEADSHHVRVFRGKNRGVLQYETPRKGEVLSHDQSATP